MACFPPREKKLLLEKKHEYLSLSAQCSLLGIARSTAYYQPVINLEELRLMEEIDQIYTKYPFYGSRRIRIELLRKGYQLGRRRVCTLMNKLGLQAIFPKQNLSIPHPEHNVYPYLLRGVSIETVNQVWSTDITYIRLQGGFIYLVAVLDWFSRYVLSWNISLTLEKEFCIEALEQALKTNTPDIFNTDQGSQFTSPTFTSVLKERDIQISMDGKGRCHDNIFVERLWRSVKYEEVYLKQYSSPLDAYHGLKEYFYFYNNVRPHQSLNYKTPAQIYF